MGCSSSHIPPTFQYASILPGTEDLAKGLGPIYRCPGCEKEMRKRRDDSIVNVIDMFHTGLKKSADLPFLGYRPIVNGEAGDYQWYTYNESEQMMKAYARSIAKYELLSTTDGTEKRTDGTPIMTMGHFIKNCPAALISQYATWYNNGTVVTLYETLGPEALATVVSEAELKTVLCTPASGLMLLNCISTDPARFSSIHNLVIEGELSADLISTAAKHNVTLFQFSTLISEGKDLPEQPFSLPGEHDFAMICYTSGTTGIPKGALLTHGNMVAVATAVVEYIDTLGGFNNEDSHISYLPMAHVFEHFVQLGVTFYGARIGFSQGVTAKVLDDIKHLRPAVFASVPRLLNRITDSIFSKVRSTGGVKEALFNHAFAVKSDALVHEGQLHNALWDRLVFQGVRELVGLDRLKFMVTGSAPIADDCLIALRVIFGCSVIQGLGLSETAGGICCSYMQDVSTVGHCGGVICCAEARLVSVPEMGYLVTDTVHGREVNEQGVVVSEGTPCNGRGEACYRGYNVIRGYYKRPEINKEAFDSDGWYHSGDIALWRPNGAIQVIDRKKDIFKLAQGEYISPDKITAVYQACLVVGSLFVYGDSFQSFLVGIVVPDEAELRKELRGRGMDEADMDFGSMCRSDAVRAVVFEKMMETANASKLMGFEKVKNIHLDSEMWTVDNGMLTPTMKLKRDFSKNHYKEVINKLYAEGMMQVKYFVCCKYVGILNRTSQKQLGYSFISNKQFTSLKRN